MAFKISAFIILFSISSYANAQLQETYTHRGEYGISAGLDHYFGDLDANNSLGHPKFSAGVFYQWQLNNYIGIKLNGNYSFLGYSDSYNSPTDYPYHYKQNLSFNTDVWELSVAGNFNFFKFFPELPEYRFTPYLSAGVGVINFNPYTYLGGNKYYLRSLETEGESQPYSPYTWVVPVGFGFKYNVSDKINLFTEFIYRFTGTGYLDDVNGRYVGTNNFPANSAVAKLQDRSYVYGNNLFPAGKQRGNGKNDSYVTFQVGISFNLAEGYNCPSY